MRAEAGGQIPVRKPNFLDSYNTALLVNEARTNDGLTKMFTQHDLELFKDGSDPYGHPNVNWYDEVFKNSAMQSNINVDVSGGTKRLEILWYPVDTSLKVVWFVTLLKQMTM